MTEEIEYLACAIRTTNTDPTAIIVQPFSALADREEVLGIPVLVARSDSSRPFIIACDCRRQRDEMEEYMMLSNEHTNQEMI